MKRYKYVNENELVNDMTKLVKKMQKNYGLKVTGKLFIKYNLISVSI